MVTYALPYDGDVMISHLLPYRVESAILFLASGDLTVDSPVFRPDAGTEGSTMPGIPFDQYQAAGLAAGETLSFRISGEPDLSGATALRLNQPAASPLFAGVLVGPNGAGKTTLLRLLATLARPTSGEVRVGGWLLPQSADRVRSHLGFVSHQPLLYADLTAEENLRFFARMYALQDAAARIGEALDLVGLAKRRGDLVGSFSRGMQQRLTIARATLHRPDVLLLDEPYTGLDQDAVAMLDEVLRSVASAGRTIVMTTHNLARGLRNSNRVAVLSRGRIVFQAASDTLDPGEFQQTYERVTRRAAKT